MALTQVTPDVYDGSKSETFSANITFTGGIIANGSIGTNGQALVSNGSSVYWTYASTNFDYGSVTGSITAGNLDYGTVT
jgi:hypothetical protein